MLPHNKKIDEIYRLVSDNNRLLRKMRRAALWGTIVKLLLYAVILGVPVFLYLTVFQPMIQDVVGTYSQIQGMQNTSVDQLQNLLNGIPGL